MIVRRDLSKRIAAGAQQMPIIAIVGPRQSGKSTLARTLFKDHVYVDLQDAHTLEFAQLDPKGFLESLRNEHGIILDEAQYAPNLFAQIKVEADKHQKAGYFILSGSQNFLLHEKISESLAGRVYFYILLPFSIHELKSAHLLKENPEHQILQGFYPRVYQEYVDPKEYYKNYSATYVERDIRMLRNISNLLTFRKFMGLCALRIGTPLQLTALASECGITVITAKSWLSLLTTSFVLFLLPPYHNNLGKRLTKSPKLYFFDVGLAASLMKITQTSFMQQRNVYGALFENMVIVDCMKHLTSTATQHALSFLRDTNGREIDLIIETEGKTFPVEIKASPSIESRYFDTMVSFNEHMQDPQKPILVYGGNNTIKKNNGISLSWKNIDSLSF